MARKPILTVNGKPISASVGDTLIEAGLMGRVVIPHDCCSGQCETCQVSVLAGEVDDNGTRQVRTGRPDTVLACLSTVRGDAEIAFDPVPRVRKIGGVVAGIVPLAPEVLEVRLRLDRPLSWLPGQYVRVTFAGFPARDLSPTFGHDLHAEEGMLIFHIRRYPDGRVSSAIGERIRVGHRATARGPFGHAFLRRGEGRLVLASTGTGWAPIWAIAVAARLGQPYRPVEILAGARMSAGLYMESAVHWLQANGAKVTMTAEDGDGTTVRRERPQALLPMLGPADTVHVAGAESMVEAVRRAAHEGGAECYADPFLPALSRRSMTERLAFILKGPRSTPDRPRPGTKSDRAFLPPLAGE